MKERRQYPRVPLAVKVEVNSRDEANKSSAKGFITNLSEGGLALETPEKLTLGGKFALQFTLLNGSAFNLQGEIVYARDGVFTKAYGVKFYERNEETFAKLKDFIIARLPQ